MAKYLSTIPVITLLLSSCTILQKTPKQELSDGMYTQNTGNERQMVYVNIAGDSIQIHQTTTYDKKICIDSLESVALFLPELKNKENLDFTLSRSSLDLDILTVPAKFRFATKNVSAQLNSELNGSVFFGFRNDRYGIKYRKSPLNIHQRITMHIGYSVGFFTSIGNTFISPTTTNDMLSQEYDGIVWSKGMAGIIGVNNLSVGLAVGFDNLLDKNNSIWIYENKPWIGLGFGLNLN